MQKKDSLSLTPTELERYAKAEKLGYAEFRRLTGCGPVMHGLYKVSETGVEVPPLSDAELEMLIGNEDAVIAEAQCHRLTYPYTASELVDFVNATGGEFELPTRFVSLVRWDGVKAEVTDAVKLQLLALHEGGQSLGNLALTFPINGRQVTKGRIAQLCKSGITIRAKSNNKASNRSSWAGQVEGLHKPNT